jgi:hypothetical protein
VSRDCAPPTRRELLSAILLAALCAALFLGSSLLPGRALVPFPPEIYDVQGAEAAAAGRLDAHEVGRGNVSMGDKYGQSLCWDRVLQQHLRNGEIPRWNREIGGGVPFVPQMAQPYQPWNLLLLLLPSEQWYGWLVFGHLVLMGTFAYGFVRRLGCLHLSGLLSVVVATLGLWTQCKVHHNVILTAALSLFPMLSAVLMLLRGGGARHVAFLAFWTGLSWSSGFAIIALQSSYLAVALALLLAPGRPRGERLRPLLRVAGGLLLGGALSLAQMVPLLLALPESARPPVFDELLLRLHGLDWDYLLTLLWPDLLHWAADTFYPQADAQLMFTAPTRPPLSQLVLLHDPNVARGNWVECSFAVSLPALLCALLAFTDRSRRLVVALFGALAVLAFGVATGSQPFFGLARLLPGIASGDLRRELFLVAMALAVLAAIGADRVQATMALWPARGAALLIAGLSAVALLWLLAQDETTFLEALARWIAADAGHPLVNGASAATIAEWMHGNVRGQYVNFTGEFGNNLAHLQVTAGRTLLVAVAAAVAFCLPSPRWRLWLCIGVAALELWHVGRGPVQTVDAARIAAPPAVVQPVLAAAPEAPGVRPRFQRLGARVDERANSLYLPNLAAYHGIEDAAAYSSLPPRREEEFFLAIEPDAPQKTNAVPGGDGVAWFHDPVSLQHPLCDLFGIRYVLTDQPAVTAPNLVDRTPAGTGRFHLLERTSVLPRATFVRTVDRIADREQRLIELRRPDRDVAHRVILEDADAPEPAPAAANLPPAEVTITAHDDERVQVHVRTAADGYLRLADAWDAGWCATVDGARSTIHIADHYLRAVYLPAGEHDVVFTFDAARVVWPPRLSLLALLAIIVLAVWRQRAPAPRRGARS